MDSIYEPFHAFRIPDLLNRNQESETWHKTNVLQLYIMTPKLLCFLLCWYLQSLYKLPLSLVCYILAEYFPLREQMHSGRQQCNCLLVSQSLLFLLIIRFNHRRWRHCGLWKHSAVIRFILTRQMSDRIIKVCFNACLGCTKLFQCLILIYKNFINDRNNGYNHTILTKRNWDNQ